MGRAICLIVALATLPTVTLAAQESVEAGSLIRLRRCNPMCSYAVGTLLGLGVGNASVVIYPEDAQRPLQVPFTRITSMDVSRGREKARFGGAVAGGLAFGGVSFWLLSGATDPCDEEAELACGMTRGVMIGSLLAATGFGALLGVLAAPVRELWVPITRRQLGLGVLPGWGGQFVLAASLRL